MFFVFFLFLVILRFSFFSFFLIFCSFFFVNKKNSEKKNEKLKNQNVKNKKKKALGIFCYVMRSRWSLLNWSCLVFWFVFSGWSSLSVPRLVIFHWDPKSKDVPRKTSS